MRYRDSNLISVNRWDWFLNSVPAYHFLLWECWWLSYLIVSQHGIFSLNLQLRGYVKFSSTNSSNYYSWYILPWQRPCSSILHGNSIICTRDRTWLYNVHRVLTFLQNVRPVSWYLMFNCRKYICYRIIKL